jgi:hypothetical protein
MTTRRTQANDVEPSPSSRALPRITSFSHPNVSASTLFGVAASPPSTLSGAHEEGRSIKVHDGASPSRHLFRASNFSSSLFLWPSSVASCVNRSGQRAKEGTGRDAKAATARHAREWTKAA